MPEIRTGYVPGALGRIVEIHETYYSEYQGFNYEFSREVAVELAAFLDRYDEADNRLWLVVGDPDDTGDRQILGSIVIDGQPDGDAEGARLRWFVLAPEAQGQGLGRELMENAMTFCREAGFSRVYLWTVARLDSARYLYDDYGFTLTEEHVAHDWGPEVTHERLDLDLSSCKRAP